MRLRSIGSNFKKMQKMTLDKYVIERSLTFRLIKKRDKDEATHSWRWCRQAQRRHIR